MDYTILLNENNEVIGFEKKEWTDKTEWEWQLLDEEGVEYESI